jgi:hypothetical protein
MNIKFSARDLAAAIFAILLVGGLCADARAASTPVSSCGTLTPAGNYVLTKNLTATGDCLVIAAANVAIDLNGKTITGNGSGSGITDDGVAREYSIVANGKIRNFQNGINLRHSGEGIISNVDSSNNTDGGIFIEQCCNTLDAVTANGNGAIGIVILSAHSSLSNIRAAGNGDGGVGISTCCDTSCCNVLVGSTVSNNKNVGVFMAQGRSFVIDSTIQKNVNGGLTMSDAHNGVIKSNTSNNGGDGMTMPSEDNMVTASKSNGNAGNGIQFSDATLDVLSGVKANNNSGNGVIMDCRGSTASLSAKNNSSANLVQTVSDGPCANVNLKAP